MKIMFRALALYLIMSAPILAEKHEQTVLEYGAQCAREIGYIHYFDCNRGTNIPITINGRAPAENEIPRQCDRPSLLSPTSDVPGQCAPYSKILDLSHGNTQISAYCKRNAWRKDTSAFYDEVNIVLHNVSNGKTCWFQSKSAGKDGIDASRVPPPDEKVPPGGKLSAVEFWKTPGEIAQKSNCISCHDAGPFILSPYIAQVWDKVPTDPWGKYSSIGPAFESHHLLVISAPDNTCVGCHRIGSEQSCDVYLRLSTGKPALKTGQPPPGNNSLANSYPLNHWMPTDNNMSHPQWDEANIRSVNALLSCCRDRNRKDPNCSFTPIGVNNRTQ